MLYQERESLLKIHYEDGFSLSITSEDQQSVVLWKYSFSQLKKSSDDGSRLLWLTFDDGDTKVSDFYKHDDMIWVSIDLFRYLVDKEAAARPMYGSLLYLSQSYKLMNIKVNS